MITHARTMKMKKIKLQNKNGNYKDKLLSKYPFAEYF